MIWLRFIPVVLFSLTAISLFTYQGIEIIHAFNDYFSKK